MESEIKTFGFGCRTYSDDEGRRSGLPPVGLIQQAAGERRSDRVIAYTDAAFSTNAQALEMCPQLKREFGGLRAQDSSPFALVWTRISWLSSLVHEGKAATIC